MSMVEPTHTIRAYLETLTREEQEQVAVADVALHIAAAFERAREEGYRQATVSLTAGLRHVSPAAMRPYLRELGYELKPACKASADGAAIRITPLRRGRGRFPRPCRLRTR